MDFKEFLLQLAKMLDNKAIKEIADKLKDNDRAITDEVATELQEALGESMGNLLSVEAAQNNKELEKYFKTKLFPTLKGEILGNIDTEIDGFAAKMLSTEAAQEILSEENTKNKLKLLNEKAETVMKKKFNNDQIPV